MAAINMAHAGVLICICYQLQCSPYACSLLSAGSARRDGDKEICWGEGDCLLRHHVGRVGLRDVNMETAEHESHRHYLATSERGKARRLVAQ